VAALEALKGLQDPIELLRVRSTWPLLRDGAL
jgi:hypothetical protein